MAHRSRKWTNGDVNSDEELSEYVGMESHVVDKLKKKMEKSLVINKHEKEEKEEKDDSDEKVDVSAFGNTRVDEFDSPGRRSEKPVVFPSPGDLPPSDESSDEGIEDLLMQPNINHPMVFSESEDEGPIYVCEIYLPNPSTLVPALRGSREKQGLVPKKRRVSWSPEVCDPVPKEVAYAVKTMQKKQPKSEKKTGKDKQKGNKAAKASGSKDKKLNKKQIQKNSGNSRRGQKSSDSEFW